ncbi:cupin domain-containing protein [Mesorhizobium sp.]|uniref:cupin domain-containing protein n=1 Tax=Mesorhizobium sp. TaxID=1871066 RepID=UPI0025EF602F|nr:cupin domain-containing protein [Mesorhizobium sp.]
MPPRKINLVEAADQKISKVFDPHIAGDVNDSQAKVAKFGATFDWHAHEHEDEAFLVLRGRIAIDFRDGPVELGEGDFIVVPRRRAPAAFADAGARGADVRTGDDAQHRQRQERSHRHQPEAALIP